MDDGWKGGSDPQAYVDSLKVTDAAELIERLRNNGWNAFDNMQLHAEAATALETLQTENERLREALKASVEYMQFQKTQCSEPYPLHKARAALEAALPDAP